METYLPRENAVAEGATRTALVGLGNPFHGDEAAGLVAARLVHLALCHGEGAGAIDLLEPPSSGFALSESLVGYQRAVIIDALVDPHAEVGSVWRLDVSECYGQAPLSPHTGGFHEGLALARAVGLPVPSAIGLYGVVIREPQCFAESLSHELGSRLSEIVASIMGAEFAPSSARRSDGEPAPRAA